MITEEAFANRHSHIHSIDPRLRIISGFVLSVVIALSYHFTTLVFSLAFSFVLIGLARLNVWIVSKRLSAVIGFLIMIWVMLPLTFEGEVLAQFGIFKVYQPGIELSARISLKSCTILLLFIALVATMPVVSLANVFYFYRLPGKFVLLLLITYRYLFVIYDEYSRIRTAMRIRAFIPGTNLHSFKTIAYLVGMLLVRASLRAERVNQAMKLRGFQGRFYNLEDFAGYQRSLFFPCLVLGFLGVFFYLEWIVT